MAKTIQERNAILEKAIAPYLRKGWRLQARGEVWAQLYWEKKSYGCLMRILWGLFLLFFPRRNRVLTITVTDSGKLQKKMRKV